MDDAVLYAAYGSNLDPARMLSRCAGAEAAATGSLENWRLVLNLRASIVPETGARTPVAIWRIPLSELPALDAAEGYAEGRPEAMNTYARVSLPVAVAGNERFICYTYVEARHRPGPPDAAYVRHLRDGYAHFGFDAAALQAALSPWRATG
ncbi:gamma-glutamylcyclotransferase family protein [Falsiroseomonas sp. CW058]|uniref:gamma-glutamylcyclotransferase family protein n=1 Tax=Falsiroseomonas sp. CW058 TaxID=3388664 RepID=UPI003D31A5A1